MKVQGNFSSLIKNQSAQNCVNPSFKGPYIPRNYTGIRELSDLIYENSSGPRKMLMAMYKNSGENMNNIVTAVGTAAVAPIFIAFNPASKEDSKTKAYTALRQPISAAITLSTQLLVMSNYNKWIERHAAFLGVDEMDLAAKPPKSVLKPRAKEDYRIYLADCVKKNIEPEKKSKWIEGRIRDLQDEAFYNKLRELRQNTKIGDIKIEEAIKHSEFEAEQKKAIKPVLKKVFGFTDEEIEGIKTMKDLKANKKRLLKGKDLEFDMVKDAIDREAMKEAVKNIEAKIDMEAKVKYRVTEHLHDMKNTFNQRRIRLNSKYTVPKDSIEENNQFVRAMKDEIHELKVNILQKKLEDLKPEFERIIAKPETDRTIEEHITEAAYRKLLKAKSIDDIKDHGKSFAEVKKNVLVKRKLITQINKAEARLKGWKDRSGLVVGLIILPATCGILNWAYPRIMEKCFPKLSAAKKASKEKLYGIQPKADDQKAKEAK